MLKVGLTKGSRMKRRLSCNPLVALAIFIVLLVAWAGTGGRAGTSFVNWKVQQSTHITLNGQAYLLNQGQLGTIAQDGSFVSHARLTGNEVTFNDGSKLRLYGATVFGWDTPVLAIGSYGVQIASFSNEEDQ